MRSIAALSDSNLRVHFCAATRSSTTQQRRTPQNGPARGSKCYVSRGEGFCETGSALRAGPAMVVFSLSVSVGLVRPAVWSGRAWVAIGPGLLFPGLAALTA